MFGFTLNSAVPSTSLGLRLTAPVAIPAAVRAVDDIEVEGRAGTLTRFTGWEDTELELELAVSIRDGLHQYRRATHELTNAQAIALTAEPGIYRKVKHCEVGELRRELSGWGFFTARLTCQPFAYLTEGLKPVMMSESGTITNPGLLDADSIITVTGTGALSLTINARVYHVNSPAGSVTLDSERLIAHVSGRVQADALTEAFPTLKPGVNRITLGTGISKIEIVPNWRNP
ncbi:hypothetical protein BSZ39_12640 [Bowdeniella nasicola]|uniref:Phage-related protein n=1 Tax=Bowdeniella nasicola TaxID=208480 RepID=A0A1Q5PWP1_9ACTO|nr:hypothetical protein [Bowdeniella nasicola]OKL51977.1 hypothetical protein BSZ39_12640 [Bowdeniella nasicola]